MGLLSLNSKKAHKLLALLSLILLWSPTQIFVCAVPDPFQHTNLNWYFPSPPRGYFKGCRFAAVKALGGKAGASLTDHQSFGESPTSIFSHEESMESAVGAVRRAVAAGFDLVSLDISCSQVQRDPMLAAAVKVGRRAGAVVLCEGGPNPVFVDWIIRGGGMSYATLFLPFKGGMAGGAYMPKIYAAAADLIIHLPKAIILDPTNQHQKVTVTVSLAHSDAVTEEQKPQWREVHVLWVSTARLIPAEEWVIVIRTHI